MPLHLMKWVHVVVSRESNLMLARVLAFDYYVAVLLCLKENDDWLHELLVDWSYYEREE